MKLARLLAFWCIPFAVILFGAAIASENSVDHSDKASVDVVTFGKMVDITIIPIEGYKWNDKFPSTLKFSVCSDEECVIITEKIKIKNN